MRLVHRPSVVGRFRAGPGLPALIGLVVAVTTVLTTALPPLTERTADRAVVAAVRDAGPQGAVVATLPDEYDDPSEVRDPQVVAELRLDADAVRHQMPARLAAVVRPGVASVTTPALQLLDRGPGRYLRLAYVDAPEGSLDVTYTAGRAPTPPRAPAPVGPGKPPPPWPVPVALSQEAATALGLAPGDRIPAEDEQHRPFLVVVSGVYEAADPGDDAWQTAPELLQPIVGRTQDGERTQAAALVPAATLPDLSLALPADDLTRRVTFVPSPSKVSWRRSAELAQAVVSLQTLSGAGSGDASWDSLLGRVLDDAQAQIASARGQAQVLVVGLLTAALLVLLLAAQLLARRRAGALAIERERGASLAGIAAGLLVESVLVAGLGAGLGLVLAHALVGDASPGWALPGLVVAALAGPMLGAAQAARATDARRVPANRTARRTAARARQLRRVAVEAAVVALAVVSWTTLRHRGVLGGGGDGGDLVVTSSPTWIAAVGGLVVLRLVPPAARWGLARSRRSVRGGPLFVSARVVQTAVRALPLLVVTVAVAQLVVGVSLVTTERQGQQAGALLSVGGDARSRTTPGASVAEGARRVASAPGVRGAVAARVVDGLTVSSQRGSAQVRLVVVDAAAYASLLAASPMPDAPQLADLSTAADGDTVPALLLGGDPSLRQGLQARWIDGTEVPLTVVGTAPSVGDPVYPVVVVDTRALAAAGVDAPPDTVWAVGSGAASAVRAAAGPGADVDTLDAELATRRTAPLAEGLVDLAAAASLLLLLLVALGVVLAAASEAPARAESLGRLRALGLGSGPLRRVLLGELAIPVVISTVAGLALGVGCARLTFDHLSLGLVTGQLGAPALVVPWWVVAVLPLLLVTVLLVGRLEAARLHRTSLAQLLRGGGS